MNQAISQTMPSASPRTGGEAKDDIAVDSVAVAYGLSFAISSVLSSILVVVKEESASVQQALAALTGHHWVSHGLLYVIVFPVLGWAFGRVNGGKGIAMTTTALLTIVVGGWAVSGLIIVGFFLSE